jgi:hypothetical protein
MHLCNIISWLILAEVKAEEAVQGRCRIGAGAVQGRCSIGASRLAVGWRRHPGLGYRPGGRAVTEGGGGRPATGWLADCWLGCWQGRGWPDR